MVESAGALKFTTVDGRIVDAKLYCHQETVSIAGTNYYLLKTTSADASGTTLSVSVASTGRKVLGKFVFPLSGIASINSATINAIYRAYTGGGTVYDSIDILILKSDGTVRTTIATNVSASPNLGTSWATYTGADYSFSQYDVVDQTDYLEIDYYANITSSKSGRSTYLRIDDNTLSLSDQTRSQEWSFVRGFYAVNDIGLIYDDAEIYLTGGLFDTKNNGVIYDDKTISLYVAGWKRVAYDPNYNVDGWRKVYTVVPSEWLSGWSYRKSHVINSASGAGTNYQVRIVVHYGSGTDSGADVYLNSKCRTDFGDVRFTRSDGTTLLDYWMETKVDSDYAIFWVEVADDLSSSNATIYIYYGKSDATTTSNGANTFLFFDHFDSATETLTFYGAGTWSRDIANSIIKWQPTTSGDALAVKDVGVVNVKILTRFRIGVDNSNAGASGRARDASNWYNSMLNENNQYFSIEKKVSGTWSRLTSASLTVSLNTWYRIHFKLYGTSLKSDLFSDSYGSLASLSITDTSFQTQTKHGLQAYSGSTSTYTNDWDFVAIAKYVDPEPSHGSWGSEEAYVPSNWVRVLYEDEL
jgi:hypothetical protein